MDNTLNVPNNADKELTKERVEQALKTMKDLKTPSVKNKVGQTGPTRNPDGSIMTMWNH